MKKLLFLAFLAPFFLPAQKITAEKAFRVDYPISTVGFPSNIVAGEEGDFAYLEYWSRGQGRKFPNHYLQSYDGQFNEQWFQPLTKQGAARLGDIQEVVRLGNSIGVIGRQFSPSAKRDQLKMQLFDLKGSPQGGLQTLSSYTKKERKGFEDITVKSPDNNRMLWVGHNPTAKAGSRTVLASVWSGDGRKTWGKKVYLPQLSDEKYQVKQAAVDNKGNAYFLLAYETLTNTDKDTVNLPIVVRYDHKEGKTTEHRLEFPGASLPECYLHITEKGELAFFGILADGSDGGFVNGAKRFETGLRWNKIVYRLFDIERELLLKQEYTMEFPEAWQKRYGERGANFSEGEVLEHKGQLYWVMEEHYTQIHNGQLQHLFYDVAVIAIDKENGSIRWASTFGKKQRDYSSPNLLSYSRGFSKGKLQFVYLTQRGAQGQIRCTSIDLETGEDSFKNLASNQKATYLFFPRRSGMIDSDKMLLMGVGDPVGNDYKLIEITFE